MADEGTNTTDETSMVRGGGMQDIFVAGQGVAAICLDIRGGVRDLSFERCTFGHATDVIVRGGYTATPGIEQWHGTFGLRFYSCGVGAFTASADCVRIFHSYFWSFVACELRSGGGDIFDFIQGDDIFVTDSFARNFGVSGYAVRLHPQTPGDTDNTGAHAFHITNSLGFANSWSEGGTGEVTNGGGQHLLLGVATVDGVDAPVMDPGRHIWYLDDQGRNNFRRDLRIASVTLSDDFMSGGTSSGTVGSLGWACSPAIARSVADEGHPGIINIGSGSSAGDLGWLTLWDEASNQVMRPADSFILEFVVRLTQVDTNTMFRFGLLNAHSADPPANGIFIEKEYADTGLWAVCRASGTETRTSLVPGVAAATWYRFTIRRRGTSYIGFSLGDNNNWADDLAIATNVPTVTLGPTFQVRTQVAVNKGFTLDAFQLSINGLTR